MAVNVTIQGTVIPVPESGDSPNWAQAMTEFAQAVGSALSSVVGSFDVPPQVFAIDNFNPGTNVPIPALTFSTANVRGALIKYACHRITDSLEVSEEGTLNIVYNASGTTGNKWSVSRVAVGDALISFLISDIGKVSFTTATIAGLNHIGQISYSATASLQA